MGWLNSVIDRAEAGDREALKTVRQAYTDLPQLWSTTDVLRTNAERSMLDGMLGTDKQLFTRATIEHQLETMRSDLRGEAPTPLERLLVDRIVLCWLECQQADLTLAQRMNQNTTLAQGEYHQRRAERAEKRLFRAITALATVRRLGIPAVQVNVAEEIKQVNVVG